jgi:hypothetical protein
MKAYLPIAEKFKALGPILNEQGRRLWAATEAMGLGRGGVRWRRPNQARRGERHYRPLRLKRRNRCLQLLQRKG